MYRCPGSDQHPSCRRHRRDPSRRGAAAATIAAVAAGGGSRHRHRGPTAPTTSPTLRRRPTCLHAHAQEKNSKNSGRRGQRVPPSPPPPPPPRRRHVAVAQAPPIARGAGAPGREAQPPKGNCTPTAPVSGLRTPTTSSAGRWAPLSSDHRVLRPRLHSMAVAILPHHKAATRARLSTAVADRCHPPRVQVAMPQWSGVRRLPKAVSGG